MKITLIGAGSTVFARNLIGDFLSDPSLSQATIALYDIDPVRLSETERVALKLYESLGLAPRLEITMNLREALEGADSVLFLFQVGGYKPSTIIDFEVPKSFDLRQTIADTIGIGGIMRALRSIPVFLKICSIIEELCPHALILNYVNPMAMNCMAMQQRFPNLKILGLCHSVQETIAKIAVDLGRPGEELDFLCAGINHMSFFLRIQDMESKDLYPDLKAIAHSNDVPENDLVRYEVLKHLGFFVTESSEHFAEYVPWFIKRGRRDLIEKFKIPLDEYPRRCEEQIQQWNLLRDRLEEGDVNLEITQSSEYAASILKAYFFNGSCTVNANIVNRGLIDELPKDACVEVPCKISGNLIEPSVIHEFPQHLAALVNTNVAVQRLTVKGSLDRHLDSVYYAAYMDPHTAAELSLAEIKELVDQLIESHGDWIPTQIGRAHV